MWSEIGQLLNISIFWYKKFTSIFNIRQQLQKIKSDINSFSGFITFDLLNQKSGLAVTQGKLDDLLMSERASKLAEEI